MVFVVGGRTTNTMDDSAAVRSGSRARASASATAVSGVSTTGLDVIRPPAVSGEWVSRRRTEAESPGSIRFSSISASVGLSTPSRSAASSGSISSSTSADRSVPSCESTSAWSSSGSSCRMSASRSSLSALSTS
ncbi:hypothetical protein PICSAR205_04548 [Mycobacterium avium subsp. paratuberculosis]|nr:hypothetical protein PICSAR205_04548 [Mycobacterium avium subsp. paratuberculosis]